MKIENLEYMIATTLIKYLGNIAVNDQFIIIIQRTIT